MNLRFAVAALIAIGALSLDGQDMAPSWKPTMGIKAGVPLTNMFTTYTITSLDYPGPYKPYSYAAPSYIAGANAEFRLPKRSRFEVDGLFRRGSFAFEQPANQFYSHTKFTWWEIPGVLKYSFGSRRYHPFADIGASLRHISDVRTNAFAPNYTYSSQTSDILRNKNSYGGVAGVGLTFSTKWLGLSPELRYTRWTNQAFGGNGLTNKLDQADVLLGVSF